MSAEFALSIKAAGDTFQEDFRTWIRAIALDALGRIVLKTPVDTGRARGNWNVVLAVKASIVTGEITDVQDKSGQSSISKGSDAIGGYPEGEYPIVVIFNNLPYIVRLEDGYSKQAPQGMIALTLQELTV